MRSSAIAASLEPRVESSVLKSACCAAASLLTPSNASTYRTLLVHFGDDPVACTFVIFALGKHNIFQHTFCFRSSQLVFLFLRLMFFTGGEVFEISRATQEDDSNSLLQVCRRTNYDILYCNPLIFA